MKAPLKSNLRISDICFLCYILCKCALCWALSFIVFYCFYLCRVVPNLVCCDKRRCWCPSGLPRGRAWLFLSKNLRSMKNLLGSLWKMLVNVNFFTGVTKPPEIHKTSESHKTSWESCLFISFFKYAFLH